MPLWLRRSIAALALLCLVLGPVLPTSTRHRGNAQDLSASRLLGVHGRMTDEVESQKIDRSVQMMADMGAGWLVEYFPWAYIEPNRGRYDWEHSDIVMAAAAARGIRVIARLDMVPDWARPKDSSPQLLPEERYADYAAFAAAFVSRYRGTLKDVIVWNEPNLRAEWGYRPADPAAYVRLLRTSYTAIKEAAPEVSVVAAGLAPTLDTGEAALNDLTYLQEMYDAGAAPYFDKLAIHAYGWRNPPDDSPAPDRINFARAELLHQVMVRNGDGDKRALITESGWNDHPRWSKAIRPSQRIQYSLRALEKAQAEWPWVEALCFWSFRLPRDSHNYNDGFTFVTVDFQPKPIYQAFRQVAAGKGGQ